MSSKSRNEQKRRIFDEECAAEEERERAKNEKYRYLPASERALDDLVEEVGPFQANLIMRLIETMISETILAYK